MSTPALTPTPRTDAAWAASSKKMGFFMSDLAETLERELAALTAERDQLRAATKACEACDEPTAFEVRQLRAELAAERARLDAGTILLTLAGERVWACGVDLRAAIDAGMREGEK